MAASISSSNLLLPGARTSSVPCRIAGAPRRCAPAQAIKKSADDESAASGTGLATTVAFMGSAVFLSAPVPAQAASDVFIGSAENVENACQAVYEYGRAASGSSDTRPADYCEYLRESKGISISSVAAPALADPAPASSDAGSSLAAGAVLGFLGLGAAGVSYSAKEKVQEELAAAKAEVEALKADMEAVSVSMEAQKGVADLSQPATFPEADASPAPAANGYSAEQLAFLERKKQEQEKIEVERKETSTRNALAGSSSATASLSQEAEAPPADADEGEADESPKKFWIDVPTDCFGGVSPERKAADALCTLVTSVAVRTLIAGENEESKVYSGLSEAAQAPMRSTERWIANLMKNEDNDIQLAAVDILNMRQRYAEGQFDWTMLKVLASKGVVEERQRLHDKHQVQNAAQEEASTDADGILKNSEERGDDWIDVPSDAFDGLSPEQKAANALRNLFTFVAVRAIMAQEEGYDGMGQSKVYKDLVEAVQTPIQSSEEWMDSLMKSADSEMMSTAVRILATREQYVNRQFDWKTVEMWAVESLAEEKRRLCEMHPVVPRKEIVLESA